MRLLANSLTKSLLGDAFAKFIKLLKLTNLSEKLGQRREDKEETTG